MPRLNYNSTSNAETKALDQFTELFIEKLENLKADTKWQQPWFSENALNWPTNLSGRSYNAGNALFLTMLAEKNKYESSVWGTFNRFTALNLQKGKNGEDLPRVAINKGEKSAPVFLTSYTVVNNETKEKISYDDYKRLDAEEQKEYSVYPKLNVYNVFNIHQTNLKEARPELYNKLVEQNNGAKYHRELGENQFPVMDKIVNDQRWVCPVDIAHRDASYYSISKNAIFMPERSQFKDDEAWLGTFLHEAAHCEGREGSLNRFNPPGGFDEAARGREELIAELTAALVGQREGLVKYPKVDSVPYVKSWLDSLHESNQFIKTVMCDVKKCAQNVMSQLDNVKLEMQIEKGQQAKQAAEPEKKEHKEQGLVHAGTYSIPEWSLPYLVNQDPSGLDDEEIEMVDKFVKEHFPNGFTHNIQWNDPTEFNRSPAFGERDPSALTDKGEYPFCAVKTFPVDFYTFDLKQTQSVEAAKEEAVAKDAPAQEEQEEETVSRGFRR